jgi:transposase
VVLTLVELRFSTPLMEFFMSVFVGCDVSQALTHIAIVDSQGKQLWYGKVKTCPSAIADAVRDKAPDAAKVGMESGALSPWLYHALKEMGVPIVCIDARHAKAGLQLQGISKTDKKDAQGIARIMQTGWYREVSVKELDGQTNQTALKLRKLLIKQRTECTNFIRGTLKAYGIILRLGKLPALETLELKNELLITALRGAYATLDSLKQQITSIDISICAIAAQDQRHALLQTIPGIGPITAFAVINTIGDPERFKKSRSVGAYLGLTVRRNQSGQKDVSGRISRCGDAMTRSYLYEAAGVLPSRSKKHSALQNWGRAIYRRSGYRKACIAVARKMAVTMHKMLLTGECFRYARTEEEQLAAKASKAAVDLQNVVPATA